MVTEDGGKLSGSLIGAAERPREIPLIDPKLEGNTFTFKICVNEKCMAEVKLKIDGKKLAGTFGCAEASGTIKGAKQS